MVRLILLANHPYLWINIKGTPFSTAIDIHPELNLVFINGSCFGPVADGPANFTILPPKAVGTKNVPAPLIPLMVDGPNLDGMIRG